MHYNDILDRDPILILDQRFMGICHDHHVMVVVIWIQDQSHDSDPDPVGKMYGSGPATRACKSCGKITF